MLAYSKLLVPTLMGLFISLMVLLPSNRKKLLAYIYPAKRNVLATLRFDLKDEEFQAVKIQERNDIHIEIYRSRGGIPELVNKFTASNSRDVFFDFNSSLSNLFTANIDQDEFLEVVVPILDKNLVSRLNVIKYNPGDKSFSYYGH